jgi:hypothetical protein
VTLHLILHFFSSDYFSAKRTSYLSKLYVEDFTVAEVSHDGDTTQCEAEEFQGTDKEDEVEQEDGEEKSVNMQYDIDDHKYISQTDGYQKLKQVKQGDTKFIICSPDEPLGNACFCCILLYHYKGF